MIDQGQRNEAVWHLLRDNIRVSDLVVGDMEAQIAACRIGAVRFVELIDRYGLDTVEAACAELFDYSERLMRQAIEQIPDGRYTAAGYMDGYLDDPSPSRRNLPIVVTIESESGYSLKKILESLLALFGLRRSIATLIKFAQVDHRNCQTLLPQHP